MQVAILGRQPTLGKAELEKIYGPNAVTPLTSGVVQIDSDVFDIRRLGGTLKAGRIVLTLDSADLKTASQKIIQHYLNEWASIPHKITLGISSYGFTASPRDIQKIGISLKSRLKKSGVSLRLIPNADITLSTATSHHNKLGLSPNKVELLIIKTSDGKTIVAESTGAQNITAYARRDQMRPKRDAFVGMLPPKLAQIMINLASPARVTTSGAAPKNVFISDEKFLGADSSAGPASSDLRGTAPGSSNDGSGQMSSYESEVLDVPVSSNKTILDPFCGTGVILQEAALMGYSVYGTDLSEKMIRYTRDNLNWLADTHHIKFEWFLHEGDATKTKWERTIDAVVAETYLGQPFSAPPSAAKLAEVTATCDQIITGFLKNLSSQIKPGTPICIAVPAWRDTSGNFTHLPLIDIVGRLGYKRYEFKNVSQNDLLYYRPDQIVARELLVLTKI